MLSAASGFVCIAGEQCDLDTMRVAKIANIKMGAIRVTKTGLALVKTSSGKRGRVKVTNLLLTARL